jgi:hypothetical protein
MARIEELLKKENLDIRITCNSRWLIWSGFKWMVFEHRPYARQSTRLYENTSFEEALNVLAYYQEEENE